MRTINDLDVKGLKDLLQVYAKNWIAHDGCWFQGIEEKLGLATAQQYNDVALARFTAIEASRILHFLGRQPGEGIDALVEAFGFRLYSSLNRQSFVERDQRHLIFQMNECPVQVARKRKGLPDYSCKQAGIIEYSGFASTIDPRIRTRCIGCPPDPHPDDWWCAWEFTLDN